MAFPINYASALGNLSSGNLTGATTLAYTLGLGVYAWFIVMFGTMAVVYIKTQSAGLTVFIGMLWFSVLQVTLGVVGDGIFYTLISLGLAFVLYQLWKGQ